MMRSVFSYITHFQRYMLIFFISFFSINLYAQDHSTITWDISRDENPQQITAIFTGQLQHAVFFDSNQVVGTSDDFFLFFSENKQYDVLGKNILNKSQCNMSMLETLGGVELHTPDMGTAHPMAYIEFDALADPLPNESQIVINRFRFRHAYLTLNWNTGLEFLLGQTAHPIRLDHIGCYPRVLNRNHGAPIAYPETFQPQVRITKKWNHACVLGAAISQLNALSDGPIGASSIYLRNAITPMLHGQFYIEYDTFRGGFGIDYKRIAPRLVSNTNYKVHETLNSVSALMFAKIRVQPLIMRTAVSFAQNSTDYSSISGYAVTSICPGTDFRRYANTRAISGWVDLSLRRKIEPGIFLGITKNIGASQNVLQSIVDSTTGTTESLIYGFASNIDKVVRTAPRIYWHIGSLTLGAEFEYTRSWYGAINNRGRVVNTHPVGNLRFQLGSFYFF